MLMRASVLAVSGGICLATLAIGGAAHGQDDSTALESDETTVSIKAKDVVTARRAAYFLSTQAVGQIKAGIDEGGDLRRTASAARMLANWAMVLPSMFPEGSKVEGTRALDTVWSDRAGFEARASAYREAALELARVADEGDREGASNAFMQMASTCHACHQSYREE